MAKLRDLKLLESPFTLILEDIAGESHISNPNAPAKDKNCTIQYFTRSEEENKMLGIFPENNDQLLKPMESGSFALEELEGEVLSFPTNCPECNSPCSTNMKMTSILYQLLFYHRENQLIYL